jgi:predicted O-methyltransferase YrrM
LYDLDKMHISFTQRLKKFLSRKFTPLLRILDHQTNSFWYDWPFGQEPHASKEEYLRLALEVRNKIYPEIENYEKQTTFAINENWLYELALHTQVTIKKSPLCYAHGRLLYSALSQYLSGSQAISKTDKVIIWETGTAKGFSSICMAKALNDHAQPGVIITFDRLPHKIRMYWNCIDDHEGPKTRAELISPWQDLVQRYIIFHQGDTQLEMQKVYSDRINFAFLDGAHTYKDVWFEFEQIHNSQHSGDVIVYDDYTPNQYPGLTLAVDEICTQYNYERTDLKAHTGRGYVIAVKK